MEFITNDVSLKNIANLFLGEDSIRSVKVEPDNYTGYLEVKLSNNDLTVLYENLNENLYNLNLNQYLIVRDEHNEIVDKLCWTGSYMRPVKYYNFSSR